MRKVKFQKFIPAIETEEYKAVKGSYERSLFPKEKKWVEGTNIWTDFIFDGWFHQFGTDCDKNQIAIIESEGVLREVGITSIQFVDTIEAEQLAEFAKAAMQGLCSSFVNDETGRDEYNYAAMSVMIAKATIAELKKQKP